MKSLSVKVGFILIIGFAIFCYAEVWGADWKFYTVGPGVQVYGV